MILLFFEPCFHPSCRTEISTASRQYGKYIQALILHIEQRRRVQRQMRLSQHHRQSESSPYSSEAEPLEELCVSFPYAYSSVALLALSGNNDCGQKITRCNEEFVSLHPGNLRSCSTHEQRPQILKFPRQEARFRQSLIRWQ